MIELIVIGLLSFYAGYSMTPEQKEWLGKHTQPCQEQQIDPQRRHQ